MKAYNVLRYVTTGLPISKAWRWFRGLFKKKSNGVSLCKSEENLTDNYEYVDMGFYKKEREKLMKQLLSNTV